MLQRFLLISLAAAMHTVTSSTSPSSSVVTEGSRGRRSLAALGRHVSERGIGFAQRGLTLFSGISGVGFSTILRASDV